MKKACKTSLLLGTFLLAAGTAAAQDQDATVAPPPAWAFTGQAQIQNNFAAAGLSLNKGRFGIKSDSHAGFRGTGYQADLMASWRLSENFSVYGGHKWDRKEGRDHDRKIQGGLRYRFSLPRFTGAVSLLAGTKDASVVDARAEGVFAVTGRLGIDLRFDTKSEHRLGARWRLSDRVSVTGGWHWQHGFGAGMGISF